MRTSDKVLLAVVLGLLLLASVTVMLQAREPRPEWQDESTPTGVAANYIHAFEEDDYERAYGYLSPQLPGYPKTLQDFVRQVNSEAYDFDRDQATAYQVLWARNVGDWAVAEVEQSYFERNFFNLNERVESTFRLNLELIDGEWKISGGQHFIADCWTRTVCR